MFKGVSLSKTLDDIIDTIDIDLKNNIISAGIGAVSSFITANLVSALGIDGFAGELENSAGGAVISQVINNIFDIAKGKPGIGLFYNVTGALGNALGSFLGNKLASTLVKFDSIGGQIGSAVGSAALSAAIVVSVGKSGVLFGAKLGAFAGPLDVLNSGDTILKFRGHYTKFAFKGLG